MEPADSRTQTSGVPRSEQGNRFDWVPVTEPRADAPLTTPSIQAPEQPVPEAPERVPPPPPPAPTPAPTSPPPPQVTAPIPPPPAPIPPAPAPPPLSEPGAAAIAGLAEVAETADVSLAAPSADVADHAVDAHVATDVPAPPAQPSIVVNPVAPSTPIPTFAQPSNESTPGHHKAEVEGHTPLPMLPARLIALGAVALAFFLCGWQIARVIDEQPRLSALAWGAMFSAAVGAVAVVLWTYIVVENARRVINPARTQELPRPGYAVTTWIVPMVFFVAAATSVSYLSRRLNTPIEGTESSFPLLLAIASMLIAFPLMYSPVTYLSSVVRRVGGHGVKLGEWLWVPVALAAVGAAMVFGLRAGGAFGDTEDGFAPTWVIAVAAVLPAVVVVLLGWRAAAAVETDIERAFGQRHGVAHKTSGRASRLASILADDGPNHTELRDRGHLRQIPGVRLVSTLITAGLAGLALTSLVGAIVMFLFWQEARDGVLLAAQTDRAWEVLDLLQTVERSVAFAVVIAMSIWTLLAVTNVRLASARRRNPVFAALSWPAAAAAIWVIADRLVVDDDVVSVIAGFVAQAVVLYLPFALLERSADAVGARRNPIRMTYAVGVILLVHVQGLGGLSTLSETAESAQVGRLVGYLAIGALVQLLAMFSATESARTLSDAAETVAANHNALVEQRQSIDDHRTRPDSSAGPSVEAPTE